MLRRRCRKLSFVCWVDFLAWLECMRFRGIDDVLYSLYFCALNSSYSTLVHKVEYGSVVLLDIFCTRVLVLVGGKCF